MKIKVLLVCVLVCLCMAGCVNTASVIDPAVTAALQEGAKAASPGMKYKHYAPKTRVVLVKATAEKFAAFVNSKKNERPLALTFDGEETAENAQRGIRRSAEPS